MKVQDYLDSQKVSYEVLPHEATFGAQRLAQAVNTPGSRVAKTVLLEVDGRHILAILPASHEVDLGLVKEALGALDVGLVSESECADVFSDCEVGAIPPFGSLYSMMTIADSSLRHVEEIVFEGNRHNEAIRLRWEDFERLERPYICQFGAKEPG